LENAKRSFLVADILPPVALNSAAPIFAYLFASRSCPVVAAASGFKLWEVQQHHRVKVLHLQSFSLSDFHFLYALMTALQSPGTLSGGGFVVVAGA